MPFTNTDLIFQTQILVTKHMQRADFTQREAKVRRTNKRSFLWGKTALEVRQLNEDITKREW